ncbi:WD40-repeat-containing domain protein [Parasitella parasitica]|nr:WD40-repeat-containing domain protein [Parasitella parasitica]
MKYFTSDESGLIKWISFPPKAEGHQHHQKKTKLVEGSEEKDKKEALQPLTGTFGKVDKEQAVQKLSWAMWEDEKVLLVARKNGTIQFMSPETGEVLREFQNNHVGVDDEKKGRFVGLFIHDRHLCACTSTGDLSYTPLSSRKNETRTVLELGPDIEIMRGHPTLTHIFAIGGKERDLCIYDIKAIAKSKREREEIDAAGPNKNTSVHKKKSPRNGGLIFQAKNVKNDFLDLQQPVWIHDLQFVNKEATKVAVATHYHQFRLYDTKVARRPTTNIEIGKHPIRVLSVGTDFNHVLYADTMSTVGMLDIRTGKRAAQFKGFTGAATDLVTVPLPTFDGENQEPKQHHIASVSLDRFLRVHETSTVYRNIEDKAYLKQRLTCVLVDEEFEYPVPKIKTEEEQEEEEEEALWGSMALAKERKRKRD